MNVKTTIVLALVLVVAVGAFWIFKPDAGATGPGTATETETKAKPLYELAQLVKFEVQRPDKPKLVFAKPLKEGKKDEYEDWRLVEPIKAKATNWEVNSFADKFKAPKYKEKFTPGKDGFPTADKIGLAKPEAVIVVTDKKGGGRKIEVGVRVFGSDETYIRLAGEEQACIAEIKVRDDLKKDVEKFRSKDLLDFDKAKAVQVEIAHEGKTYLIVKGEADKWVIDRPVKASADKSKIDSLLSDIRQLRADEFIEDAPKSLTAFGLDKPTTSVTVTVEEKIEQTKKDDKDKPTTTQATQPAEPKIKRTTYTVQFGGASDLKGEKFFCKLGDQPWVVSVTKSNYEKVHPKLKEWRDAKVTQAKVLNAQKIDLTVAGSSLTLAKKGGAWKLTAPKAGKAERTAVTDLLNAIRDLKASGWEDEPKDKKAYGLDKPRAEIVLAIKGSTTPERILVGGNTTSGLLTYVHQAASKSIAVVKNDDAKKLLASALSYRDRSVMSFAKARADRIELTREGTTVVLAKTKGEWKMTKPVAAEADVDAVNDLLADLSSLKATQIAGEGDLARFGLDKPELKVAVNVQPPPPPKPKTKPATRPTTTRSTTTRPTTTKSPTTKGATTKAAARHYPTTVAAAVVKASTKPAAKAATKPAVKKAVPKSAKKKPAAKKPPAKKPAAKKPAKTSKPKAKPASKPTTKPVAKKPKPPKPRKPRLHVLLVAKKGDKVYAALPKRKLVYELSQSVYDNLTAEMHDRKPLEFETSQVTGVDVIGGDKPLRFAKKDDKWTYVPDPHLTIDEQKVKDMVTALHDLKVERYVNYAAKDLKPFGLDKPDLTVTIKLEDKKAITMLLAKPDKDGKRQAALKADPGKQKVFIVPKSDTEKFAKKVSDFVKS